MRIPAGVNDVNKRLCFTKALRQTANKAVLALELSKYNYQRIVKNIRIRENSVFNETSKTTYREKTVIKIIVIKS